MDRGRVVAPGPFVVLALMVGPVALLLGAWFDSSRRVRPSGASPGAFNSTLIN